MAGPAEAGSPGPSESYSNNRMRQQTTHRCQVYAKVRRVVHQTCSLLEHFSRGQVSSLRTEVAQTEPPGPQGSLKSVAGP